MPGAADRLIVNNKQLCLDLMGHGLYNNKSLSLKFPRVPKQFLKDFIRGVIDGDGNVRYVNRKRSPYFEITVSSGSKEFCEGLVKSVSFSLGINAKVRKLIGNTYIVQYSCRRGLMLGEWIYSSSCLCLNRKHEQYKIALCAKEGGQP